MVRENHPTIRDRLSVDTFLATPQLVYEPRGGGHGYQESMIDQVFVEAGVPRRVAVRAAHAMGVTAIVSSTDLLVVVPTRLAAVCQELADVTILPLPVDIPSFEIKQHWHERFHRDPGHAWLRRQVAELFQDSRMPVPEPA
jgi:DNA-binding transcriptional LysR family regulator